MEELCDGGPDKKVVILLLRESAVEGDRRRWELSSTTLFDISLQMMATTFEPRSPPLSSSMGWKQPPPPPPRGGCRRGRWREGCRRMCWVIILSNIPHTQLSNLPRCRRAYLNEARRSSEGRGAESIEWFIEDQAFYNSAPHPPPPIPS